MALILHLETSGNVCSVALSDQGKIVFSKADDRGKAHAVNVGVFVDEALKMTEARGRRLDAVAVSSGPGSYTGLRIGVSMAKGICYGLGIPLIAVPTLELLAAKACQGGAIPEDALICPLSDARRMEVYAAVYDSQGRCLKPAHAVVIDTDSFSEELCGHPVWFVGDGAGKSQSKMVSDQAHFMPEVHPRAEDMATLSERAFAEKRFENVAYFEPFYLKDFVATVSKKRILPT